jgi:hypothetical protein
MSGDEKKVERFYVFVDAEGKELTRKAIRRGRPPRGAEENPNAEGNVIVRPTNNVKKDQVYQITIDDTGNEVSRKERSRGRAPAGYVKMTDGPFVGHYVGKAPVKAEVQTEVKTEVKTEVPATITA